MKPVSKDMRQFRKGGRQWMVGGQQDKDDRRLEMLLRRAVELWGIKLSLHVI